MCSNGFNAFRGVVVFFTPRTHKNLALSVTFLQLSYPLSSTFPSFRTNFPKVKPHFSTQHLLHSPSLGAFRPGSPYWKEMVNMSCRVSRQSAIPGIFTPLTCCLWHMRVWWINQNYQRKITEPSSSSASQINSVQNGLLLESGIHAQFDDYTLAINSDVGFLKFLKSMLIWTHLGQLQNCMFPRRPVQHNWQVPRSGSFDET